MTDPAALAERCFEVPARVETIVHLAVVGGDAMDDDLYEWFADSCRQLLGELFGHPFDDVVGIYGDRDLAQREALAEAFVNKPLLGWLVEVATPRKVASPSGTGCHFSWASYTSKVFYADTYDAALEAGLAWAEALPVRAT